MSHDADARDHLTRFLLPRAGVRVTSVVSSSTGTLGPDDAALYVPFDCGACCAIAGDST